MVHFLRRYDPHVQVEAIEIDTEVVRLAEKYFGVKGGDKVTIRTGDGIDYLEKTDAKYDVIYMDAFLKPAAGTDATGAPLRSRTLRFYHEIQNKLTSTGLVAFNLNPHANLQQDLATIREGFAQTYVFQIPKNQGMVVLASAAPERVPLAMLNKRARELDRRFGANFSFRALLPNLQRENAR
jgi:spermidine synthase